MKNNVYKLTIHSEEGVQVLYRILNLFLRRKIVVTNVSLSQNETVYIINIHVATDEDGIETVIKQLYRIIGITNITKLL